MKIESQGFIEEGILNFYNHKGFLELLATMDDCEVEIIVRRKVTTRTLAQNRYYFGVVVEEISKVASELYGQLFDQKKVHKDLSAMFNYQMELGLDMEYKKVILSTADLSIAEFSEYIDKCILWAQEFFNFTISPPEKGQEYK